MITVPDAIHMGGVTVSDAWYHPTEQFTATGVLAESSNVGTLKIAQQARPDDVGPLREAVRRRARRPASSCPARAAATCRRCQHWSASTFANLPFGQGESMTVLQLASIYQTFANNGVRVPPRIVQSVT